MSEEFIVRKAVRRACPQILAIAGPSSSGKTLTALLVAAGLAGPGGRVGLIDAENGRGTMYADDPFILKAYPNGYEVVDLPSPWTPRRYIACIDAVEAAGCNVCVIDQASNEWEGEGGCTDIAEKDKGRWNNAKREHKRFMSRLLYSNMHIVVCLRAREKSRIIPKEKSPTGKEIIEPLGILPICEKGFMHEMLLSFLIEDSKTHLAIPVKIPGPLRHLFMSPSDYKAVLARHGVSALEDATGDRLEKLLVDLTAAMKPKLMSASDGEAIARWNNSGSAMDETERLEKRARAAAEIGTEEFRALWKAASPKERLWLKEHAATYEAIAKAADESQAKSSDDDFEGLRELLGDKEFFAVLGRHGVETLENASATERAKILDELKGMVG